VQVNMHEAKTRLSQLVQAALDGEDVVLARNGKPVARITRYSPPRIKRKPGALKGKIWLADDWDSEATKRAINEMMIPAELRAAGANALAAEQPAARYQAKPARRSALQRRKT
jgi:prevent-host-death family protein